MLANEKIIIDRSPGEIRVAVIKNGRLANLFIERSNKPWLRGAVILARITAIRKKLGASFLDLGTASGYIENRKPAKPIEGASIVVQVLADPHRNKSARVSSNICVEGNYLNLYPTAERSSISRKIKSKKKRGLIKQFIADNIPNNMGVHIKYSFDVSDLDLMKATAFEQIANWKNLSEKILRSRPPLTLIPSLGAVGFAITKYPEAKVCDGTNGELFDQYDLEFEISRALDRKVLLDDGAQLVFDEAEALTAIDIDVGSSRTPRSGLDSLVAHLAKEIIWQIRLRDIAGLIFVDFPRFRDSNIKENFLKVLQAFAQCEGLSLIIHGWTRTGLLEITRPRNGSSLKELLVGTVEDDTPALETVALTALRCLLKETAGVAYPEIVCSRSLKRTINGNFEKVLRGISRKLGSTIFLTEDGKMAKDEFLIRNRIKQKYDVI